MTSEQRDRLLSNYIGGHLSDNEKQQVADLLRTDPESARRLAELSTVECLLKKMGEQDQWVVDHGVFAPFAPAAEGCSSEVTNPPDQDVSLVKARAERQLKAFMAEQEALRHLTAEPKPSRFTDWRPRLWGVLQGAGRHLDTSMTVAYRGLRITAALAALVLVLLGGWQYMIRHQVVAKLGQSVQAQWAQMPQEAVLRPGSFYLQQGFAEILFERGAKVLVQAPCQFELCSPNRMRLLRGSISAEVPQQALGFTVDTLSSRVIDFGTEFGVYVHESDTAELHVFSGEVAIRAQCKGAARKFTHLLEGKAALVDVDGRLAVQDVAACTHRFVQSISANAELAVYGDGLNLADVVGGGNGYGTGTLGGYFASAQGTINPATGQLDDPFRGSVPVKWTGERYDLQTCRWPMAYTPVPALDYVDGVFIPDGGQGSCVVTSAGHAFLSCPDTSGCFKYNVINGWRFRYDPDPRMHDPELRQYWSQARGITLQSNCGITFDLTKMRTHAGIPVTRFRSRVLLPPDPKYVPDLDIWVLLDGQAVFSQRNASADKIYEIDIPISAESDFLSLVVTDSDTVDEPTAIMGDRCFFEQPILEFNHRP